mmetsp:Transcript_95061/g.171632  ORF Transcript_95061/g.171632 Transcript_95061/m.171632 type:complete len:253 (-) Transcript_95061:82-840(-)
MSTGLQVLQPQQQHQQQQQYGFRSHHSPSSVRDAVLLTVPLDALQQLVLVRLGVLNLEKTDEIPHFGNADHWNAKVFLDLLDGRHVVTLLDAFLAIHSHNNANHCETLLCGDKVHGLPDGRPSCDYIIDDQHARLQFANDQAALSVVLHLFSVVCVGQVAAVLLVHSNGNRSRQRDSFVRRAEEAVELDARRDDGIGVELPELCERFASLEEPGVEEVWRRPSRLQCEGSESKDLLREREFHEAVRHCCRCG